MDVEDHEVESAADEQSSGIEEPVATAAQAGPEQPQARPHRPRRPPRVWLIVTLLTYLTGIASGYLLWGRSPPAGGPQNARSLAAEIAAEVNPKAGFRLPATFGMIGPALVQAGAIDLARFRQLYDEIGKPLTQEQLAILTTGSDEPVMITPENQHFLLNLFWAFGLANQNRILTEGPMMKDGKDAAMQMASTGGWTLASKPVEAVYAHAKMVHLTESQQAALEEVAQAVYRPCCNNPTHFPDCNHGMAMLGLLELMASQGATVEQMFQAAKQVNAFWFPQQSAEVALGFRVAYKTPFSRIAAREIVGEKYFSGSGFQAVHQWLTENGLLGDGQQDGGSCGVK